jgi:PTS system mannose-specific IIA component
MTEGSTIGVVVVTHGQLATELVNAAEAIVGDLPRFAAVSIGWHDDVSVTREEIGAAIERVQATAAEIEEYLADCLGCDPRDELPLGSATEGAKT